MEMVNLTIDGKEVRVPKGSTVLQAAQKVGVQIPTLCHHPDQSVKAVCRVCMVEIQGQRLLQPACAYPVADNMVVTTNSARVRMARRTVLELILAHHPQDCLSCVRNLNCELQQLAADYGIRETPFGITLRELPLDHSNPSIVRDPNKCINCGRCVEVCSTVQHAAVLSSVWRGYDTVVMPFAGKQLSEVACTLCGQCIQVCPVGAISERDHSERVMSALQDPNLHVVVQTAPAVRVALGETIGLQPGAIVTGQMVAALRHLGFDRVFDTDFTADLTIMEEGHELLARMKNGGVLPMITSCSPGWIKFIEHFHPDLLPHLSTCKSPQQMFGALVKTYYAEQAGIDPERIFSVSVMPCTAKKYEATRPEMFSSGYQDVDAVITTRELGSMIKGAGIALDRLVEDSFDDPLGISTGAAVIFGATGGVMEAALRTVYEVVTGKPLPNLELAAVRGMQGVKAASVELEDNSVHVAVAHGLENAHRLLEQIRAGESPYQFVEVMACPGGCVGGGGQPIPTTNELRELRAQAIYEVDRSLPLRKSHENPAVQQLYAEFLGQPLGDKSHQLLHTDYLPRKRY